ncbi:serine/threonine-protein kinase TAO3-like isoform X1 [Dendronephthya gigantea]|uniref:serine/threonine-protein kinase TAO3-like isoform X1 n=2 Tax=Dendronephthya gigantea TaxID=151771 RepID=UPI00106C2AA3|nr:serine/threonine-protein kinase TAO3-like isoform X1 [Dendronephthya gigantea]
MKKLQFVVASWQCQPDVAMPSGKVGFHKNPDCAGLFTDHDPEKQFKDLKEIGHGSFGAVYYAKHVKTGEVVAIKKMSFCGKQSAEKWADIVREVKFLKQCKHENTISYKSCYLKEHTAWLVMEYCVGSCSDVLEVHKKPLAENEIAAVCKGALNGLSYLHSNDKIHRDVKAGNVLLTEDGVVKLADFGSASIISPANSFVGTPYWMAPEVILAMDEGQYDGKVDIWSLGITCIELAERKPPLFNMNAMSALYHIAQNDPPALTTDGWSGSFKEFISKCLEKNVPDRPNSQELASHEFLNRSQQKNILKELVQRTKSQVRALDNMNYKRVKKIFMNEGNSGLEASSSFDDDASSQMSSFSSTMSSVQLNDDTSIKSDKTTKYNGDSEHSEVEVTNRKTASVQSHNSSISSNHNSSTESLPGATAEAKTDKATEKNHDQGKDDDVISLFTPKKDGEEDERFATIRPINAILRQREQHQSNDDFREQMNVYKQMRQQHQKQLLQLENKLKNEMNEHKKQLDREYEQQVHQFEREMEKLKGKHKTDFDQKLRQFSTDERKLTKQIKEQQDNEMKVCTTRQKTAYKNNKTRLKKEVREGKLDMSKYRDEKGKVAADQQHFTQTKLKEHKDFLESEIRKFRRQQILHRHELEGKLLREEMDKLGSQKDQAHSMLVRHHECTQEMEFRHLDMIQKMRLDHQKTQQSTEWSNQMEYNKRAELDLKRRHLMEQKQQPKTLKAQELKIKKQFHDTVKIQYRQYKAYQKQVLQTAPKENHKELIESFKEDRNRKMADLKLQYDQSIYDMLQRQSLRLDEEQLKEQESLRSKLQKEQDLLSAYQAKQAEQLMRQHERELRELQDRVSVRRAVLEQKMDEETKNLRNLRKERERELNNRHVRELEEFDVVEDGMSGPWKHRSSNQRSANTQETNNGTAASINGRKSTASSPPGATAR